MYQLRLRLSKFHNDLVIRILGYFTERRMRVWVKYKKNINELKCPFKCYIHAAKKAEFILTLNSF